MTKNDEILIDSYLNYQMTVEERKAFEQRLEEDSMLKDKFMTACLFVTAETQSKENRLKEMLNTISKEEALAIMQTARQNKKPLTKPNQPLPGRKTWINATLSIGAAFLITLIILFVGKDQQDNMPYLYDNYFGEAPIAEYSRVGSGLPATIVQQNKNLLNHYTKKEYKEVASIFENEWKDKPLDKLPDNSILPIAYSLQKIGKEENAVELLQSLIKSGSDNSDEAEWLLLGIYLKKGDRQKALQLSEQIIRQNNHYSKQAKHINGQLKSQLKP